MRHTGIASFLLATSFALPASADCTKDAFEPDSIAPAGAVLVGGTSQQRNFCDDAEDWISIPACPGRSYSLDTSALGAAADTLIELYDPEGTTLLAVDDDVAADPTGHLAWTATCSVGCTMHARVRQRDGTNGDLRDYRIQLTGDTSPCRNDVTSVTQVQGESLFFSAIAQAIDGGLVTLGHVVPTGNSAQSLGVTRWNNDGTIGWVRKVGDGTLHTGGFDVARTADGGFVTLGGSGGPEPMLIVKLTAEGSISWQRAFGQPDFYYLDEIVASADGSVYAAGYFDPPEPAGGIDGWLLKLNALGAPDWSMRVGSAQDEFFEDVRALRDGGAVAVGSALSSGGSEDGILIEVSAAGAVVKQTAFRAARSPTNFYSVHPLNGGGYLVGGVYCPSGFLCRALVLKLTASGEIAWQRTLDYPGTYDWVTSIDALHDGSVYAQILRVNQLGQVATQETILTRWDGNGTLLWQRSLGAVACHHGIVSDDGGIAVGYIVGESPRVARIYATGNAPNCASISAANGVPGVAAISPILLNLGTGSLDEPAPPRNFGVTSSTRSVTRTCCSRAMSTLVHVTGKVSTQISWANDGFGPYDLVRGDLATLKVTGGDFTAALNAIPSSQQCLAQGSSGTLVVDTYDQPPPDTGFFYLVRGQTGACPVLYDESTSQLGARDAEITAASGPCQ